MLGVVDGIQTALALASGAIVSESEHIGGGLVVRIGIFSAVTAVLMLFVARYAEYRMELVHHARQLNMLESGRLAATSLGRAVLADAGMDAAVAGAASFAGAAVPLAIAAGVPRISWLAIVAAIAMLATLGLALARIIFGRTLAWSVALALSGAALTAIGTELCLAA